MALKYQGPHCCCLVGSCALFTAGLKSRVEEFGKGGKGKGGGCVATYEYFTVQILQFTLIPFHFPSMVVILCISPLYLLVYLSNTPHIDH